MIDLGAIERDGYAVAPSIGTETRQRLTERYEDLAIDAEVAFFASSNDLDRATARAVQLDLLDILGVDLAALLPGHRPFIASYLVKGATQGATIAFHQDLTYTDEHVGRTVVCWIPLVAVDDDNGALRIVAGSHRWTDGPRASGCTPLPTEAHQARLAALATPVPLAAGAVCAYDPAVVHGSPPNPTATPRVAVGVAMAPVGVPLVHVHHRADGSHAAYEVDADYHMDQGLRSEPEGYPEVPLWGPVLDTIAFGAALAAAEQHGQPAAAAKSGEIRS